MRGFMSKRGAFLTRFGIYFTLVWRSEIYIWKWSSGAIIYYVTVNVMDKPRGAPLSFFEFQYLLLFQGSRESSVGIATRYGLESPRIGTRWGEIFRTYPDRLRGPPSLLYNGYRVFPGGKCGRSVMLTTHSLLVPRLRKCWVIPPLTLWVLLGLLRGSLYLTLYLLLQQIILLHKIWKLRSLLDCYKFVCYFKLFICLFVFLALQLIVVVFSTAR
jgi:hypothetical protein